MNKSHYFHKNYLPYKVFIIFFSLCYGYFLAGLSIDAFMDRDNYLKYVEDGELLLFANASQGILKIISNEPLWLLLNNILYIILGTPEKVLRCYIFVFSTLFSYAVLSKGPKNYFWLILFLFVPQVLKNYVIHLRQGVAIAIFLIGFNMRPSHMKNIVLCSTPFIHASFFFVILFYFVNKIFSIISENKVIKISLAVSFSAFLVGSLSFLSRVVGARQADEYDFSASLAVSGVGFVFWFLILVFMLMENRFFFKKYFFEIFSLIFYLIAYYFVEVSGRIFESVIILVLISCLNLSGYRKLFFNILILTFFLISYTERFSLSQFGFGV